MAKVTRSERLAILDRINDLLMLDSLGFDVEDQLIECGNQLGWDDSPKPKHFQGDVTEEEFNKYLIIAKQRDVPVRVYKDRLRRGKEPKEAATTPYYKKSENREDEHIQTALKNGISRNTYWWRRRRGWTKLDASTKPLIMPNETRGRNKKDF